MNEATEKQERYISLDVIRGIALLGIAMLNALLIAYPQHFYMPLGFPLLNQVDKSVELTLMFLVRTSFYPIFSFLFGAGFALQYSKFQSGSKHYFIRRFSLLLFIGCLHGCFVWMGDILALYAITGLLLLFLVRLNTNKKLILAIVLILIAFLATRYGVQFALQWWPLDLSLNQLLDVYANGSFWEITQLRSYEFFYFGAISLVYTLPQVLGLFLLGMVAVESGFFRYKVSFKALAIVFFSFALFKLPRIYFAAFGENPALWRHVAIIFGGPALGGLYVLGIMKGLQGARAYAALTIFTDVGRMALTNYLSQSIVLTTVFYGYGFGQYATWGSLDIVLLALSLFVLQLGFSNIWLQNFNYGPFEWLWRCFSYGRWLPIQK